VAIQTITSIRLGDYQPLVQIASGGMATVYVARKVGAAGFERLVAIKRVHRHLLENDEFCTMFRDEARVCSVIRHPNVVSMLDVVSNEGELFLVLDYVESLSLGALVRAANDAGKPLPPPVVSRIMADALAGLHAAHEAVDLRGEPLDVIHRDVSPQNIIVGVDGTSRLIDFGIAKATSRISVTNSGVVKGKLRYMSPEQVKQKPLDRRSDIFAAGVVLFETLTGKRLVDGEDEGDIALGLLLGSFPAPTSIVSDLPPGIDEVMEKVLESDRDKRYQTAAELAEALERAIPPASAREVGRLALELGASSITVRREALRKALDAPGETVAATTIEEQETTLIDNTDTRRRRRRIVSGAAAFGVVVAGVFIVWRVQATRPPVATAASASVEPAAASSESASQPALVIASSSASTTPPATGRKPIRPPPPADLHRKNPYGPP
jgi:serine/threonine-protein kinase